MKNQNRGSKNNRLSQIIHLPLSLVETLFKWVGEKLEFSIRFRLALSHIKILVSAMLAAGLGVIIVFGAFNIYTAVTEDFQEISKILKQDIQDYTEIGNVPGINETPVLVYDQEGNLIYASQEELADQGYKPLFGLAWTEDSFYLAVNKGDFNTGRPVKVVVYSELSEEIGALTEIIRIILIVFPIITFLSIIAIAFSGRGLFEPIKEMTQTVKHISERNLNMRLNVSGSKNELKELALTFNEMMNRIEGHYNRQKQFVSDASHELRTPIAVIQGYAVMLDRWGKNDNEVLEESIEAIRNESENMKELLDKLLFLARHDKDTFVFEKEEFSLSELLSEVAKETQIIDSSHNIKINISEEISLFAERNRIKQAIRVFIDNAIKYTPANGEITISLETEGEYTAISIKDTGIGMTEEDLKHIFDRFYRSDKSRTKDKGGHGLGLAIAKIIILGHGGKIKVKSKVGEGSEFIIMLKTIET